MVSKPWLLPALGRQTLMSTWDRSNVFRQEAGARRLDTVRPAVELIQSQVSWFSEPVSWQLEGSVECRHSLHCKVGRLRPGPLSLAPSQHRAAQIRIPALPHASCVT